MMKVNKTFPALPGFKTQKLKSVEYFYRDFTIKLSTLDFGNIISSMGAAWLNFTGLYHTSSISLKHNYICRQN